MAQDLVSKHATVFKAEVYGIITCAYEIQMNIRQEKYVSICSDSQAALVHSDCQNNISTGMTMPKFVE